MVRRLAILLCALVSVGAARGEARPRAPVDLVDPFMGSSGDRGQLSPAAAAPFGMVQLAPDTTPANHIGYDRDAALLRGFSHTRAQGVGCNGGGGDLLISARYAGEAGPSPIDPGSQRAGAGWYHVRYGRTSITADLVAGQSVAISRFTVARAGRIVLSLDPRHSYSKHIGHEWLGTSAGDVRVQLANATVCSRGVYRLAIAGRLLRNGQPVSAAGTVDADGVLGFAIDAGAGDRIELRTALSTIDARSARTTLAAELGARSVAQLAAGTREAWNRLLSRIAFDGDPARRALFYTCLYRALQMPARVDDGAGVYRRSGGAPGRVPPGHHRYAGWSLWDNYRTQVPLIAFAAPDVAGDIADSLVDLFQSEKAQWAGPNEPFLSVRTEHAGIALLDLHRKRLGSIDPARALDAMAAETTALPRETPDQQIELAYDQWAVAQLAADRGRPALATDFTRRWQGYRTMWGRVFRDLGADADTVKARGLYQGTLWQYRWAPVFDLDWMRGTALGGARFDRELDEFFARGLFNMTNEPDIHAPFLFALTARPQTADRLVARLRDLPIDHWYENQRKYEKPIVQRSFSLSPGFAEGMDDDGGAMSAWYVWASIGLYPLVPGEPWYTVTLPAAPRVAIDVGQGRRFVIRTRGRGDQIGSLLLNGRRLDGRRLTHGQIMRGGTLTIIRE
ncbi:glycoside hydrolase domain-containing protein [Sphingomonas sp.]|uniref:glycoside hydrolase domain-containing protein n=1 Tax=Sphingomonas sp. TaxID=28214 RepID=UPI001ED086C5|nr:glycoside hydrolase domain-containing protein [Sphingomonas sp.]MBX3594810.1 glycoside hydrolase family 92 protein [Sphingomonas sp.]